MRENNRMFFHEDYVLGNIINLITPFLKNLFKFLQSVARFFVFDIYIYIYMALGHLMVIFVTSEKLTTVDIRTLGKHGNSAPLQFGGSKVSLKMATIFAQLLKMDQILNFASQLHPPTSASST